MLTTPSEWIALALALLGGLLLGLAFAPRGRKWQDRYIVERDAHAAFRRDSESRLAGSEARIREMEAERTRLSGTETRLAELERDRVSLARAQTRIAELERENARLGQASAVSAPVAAPVSATPVSRRVIGERPKRNWFDFGPGSDPRARPRG